MAQEVGSGEGSAPTNTFFETYNLDDALVRFNFPAIVLSLSGTMLRVRCPHFKAVRDLSVRPFPNFLLVFVVIVDDFPRNRSPALESVAKHEVKSALGDHVELDPTQVRHVLRQLMYHLTNQPGFL